MKRFQQDVIEKQLGYRGRSLEDARGWQAGVTIAEVELLDVRNALLQDKHAACSDVDSLREYAWELRVLRQLKPVAVSGRLNFFPIDTSLIRDRRRSRVLSSSPAQDPQKEGKS
jgi:hypothetical protein